MDTVLSPLGGDLNAESEDYRYTHLMQRIDPEGQPGGNGAALSILTNSVRSILLVRANSKPATGNRSPRIS